MLLCAYEGKRKLTERLRMPPRFETKATNGAEGATGLHVSMSSDVL